MKRYKFLNKEDIHEALNRLRDAFLAAKDGNEVEEIINGILTYDEKLKIGRRVLIAEYIKDGAGFDEIAKSLKVGKNTIVSVINSLDKNPISFELINKRRKKVQTIYQNRKYRLVGGSTLVFKRKEYTGFKRKDVTR
ncbi:MAG: hypothetical protein HYT83_00600 [Candidatus Levybacteria bacterium]|nr:hypothetical protein [Candidatus Levybacteria bacterium]